MKRSHYLKSALAGGVSVFALSTGAFAEVFNVPGGDLKTALNVYANQARVALIVSGDTIGNARTKGATGNLSAEAALARILEGTGLTTRRTATGAIGVIRKNERDVAGSSQTFEIAQAASKAAAAAGIESVLVTAQKKTEDIQTVPIAVTALSEEQLQAQKIEGGPDLLKAIPNMSFTKTNFTGYNIEIRGIGTQAVSVATDPAVAVAFNSTAFIRNHFFEQEFFDVQSVEVLRGPQGTLYGRNATAGVVNIISAKPTDQFEGQIKAEVGNYDSKRMRGFVNVPVIGDKLDFRVAGAWTERAGYAFNATTGNKIDGRNIWSTRATLGFNPTSSLHGDLIWEHFNENDDRARSTKQLCHHDSGPSSLSDGIDTVNNIDNRARGILSQGCKAGSLYDADAFGTPNGLSIPFIFIGASDDGGFIGRDPVTDQNVGPILPNVDPYGGMMQSSNLRVINSIIDPKYRANSDVFEASIDYDITPNITATSLTGYNKDNLYSFEDYNRFNTVPIFVDSSKLDETNTYPLANLDGITPGGIYCDPQLGCSNSIAGFDISQEHSSQFSQELRVESSFEGPLNFSFGGNYTRYRTLEDYYVMFNLITLIAQEAGPFGLVFNASGDPTKCTPRRNNFGQADSDQAPVSFDDPASVGCIYIDPNPVDRINGEGHNYFRSQNPYTLHSWAGFGEVYYQLLPELKFTAGLRYTDDRKAFTPIPSQVLLSSCLYCDGTVDRGYPSLPDIEQHWGKFSGRLVANWTPKLDFTDQTMFYASYSRGYKGGGANPPGIGYNPGPAFGMPGNPPLLQTLPYPAVFLPEFVNAYEVGSKNTLLDGELVLNGDVFYYDYKNYQVSQIKSRTAVNENFSAKVWGTELEATYEPIPGLRLNFAGGYQGSRILDGMQSIDIMDRTAGNPDYIILKPWIQLPDNCVVPKTPVIQQILHNRDEGFSNEHDGSNLVLLCGGVGELGSSVGPNGGAGFYKELGGNQLPNQPHFTLSFGTQYGMPVSEDWTALVRGDFYWQSQSWARVYNDRPYDKLRGYSNVNLTLDLLHDDGLQFEFYVKNVFDTTAITGSFLNSDDTALTTNVFVTDPRLIGFSVTKTF